MRQMSYKSLIVFNLFRITYQKRHPKKFRKNTYVVVLERQLFAHVWSFRTFKRRNCLSFFILKKAFLENNIV